MSLNQWGIINAWIHPQAALQKNVPFSGSRSFWTQHANVIPWIPWRFRVQFWGGSGWRLPPPPWADYPDHPLTPAILSTLLPNLQPLFPSDEWVASAHLVPVAPEPRRPSDSAALASPSALLSPIGAETCKSEHIIARHLKRMRTELSRGVHGSFFE